MKTCINLIIKHIQNFLTGFTILVSVFFTINIQAQEVLTLKDCYDLAMVSSALAGEKDAYAEISGLKEQNLSKGWLPTLDVNGSFVYNSEVIDMRNALGSLPVPGIADAIRPLPHEQYKVNLEINQVIYDGGLIKNSKALERTDLNINKKQTETDLYKLRGQINGYFFSLMLAEKQKELLINYHNLITRRISSVQSAVENGVISKSDLYTLSAEQIKIEQQLSEIDIRKSSLLKVLSGLTNKDLDADTKFVLPELSEENGNEILRPELELFDLRKEQIAAGLKIIDSRRKPKVFGFATLGYGNPPGNNFFKDEFAPYYIVGAGLKWNIFDWDKAKNEKQVITYQQSIIEFRKKDMTETLTRLLDTKKAEIESLNSLLETDSMLIDLRKKITASAGSQYENGIITATELLNEMNSEQQALISFEIHKINLALAKVEYLNISGEEIE